MKKSQLKNRKFCSLILNKIFLFSVSLRIYFVCCFCCYTLGLIRGNSKAWWNVFTYGVRLEICWESNCSDHITKLYVSLKLCMSILRTMFKNFYVTFFRIKLVLRRITFFMSVVNIFLLYGPMRIVIFKNYLFCGNFLVRVFS